MPATAILSSGVLSVTGTSAAETITVRQTTSQISIAGISQAFQTGQVSRIVVNGLAGNDVIDVRGITKPVTVNGGAGADRFLIDLTSPVTLSGYEAADRLEFSEPGQIIKSAVGANGSVWALQSNGDLRVNGGLSWTNKADFAFDNQNRAVLLDTVANGGWLGRSKLAYGNGGWDEMGSGVTKYTVANNGSVWALQSNGNLRVNGGLSWTNKADFAFDNQNRAVLLDTVANGGWLGRSKLAYGNGGWDQMAQFVTSLVIQTDGSLWALGGNNSREFLTGGLPTATLTNGVLRIIGTGEADNITASEWSGVLTVTGPAGTRTFAASAVTRIEVQAGLGNDRIDLSQVWFPTVIIGGGGNDILKGGSGPDQLFGGSGVDTLSGNNGNDWLDAGSASEVADGGMGTDFNAQKWAVNGTSASDVNQRRTGSCVFLSALAAVAEKGRFNLDGQIRYAGYFAYDVRLFVSGAWRSVRVNFDGNYVSSSVGVFDCVARAEGEFWQTLYQRAYMLTVGFDPYSPASMLSFPGEVNGDRAFTSITGLIGSSGNIDGAMVSLTVVGFQSVVNSRTGVNAADYNAATGAGHRYAVLSVYQSAGVWYVRIYNPWGYDGVNDPRVRPIADGNNDGFMTLTWDNFRATMNKISVV
jgi:hypothetical protein